MPVPADDPTPYLSVVVAARNDNHGGNMLGRMQAFIDCWIGQAQRYNLPSEIVVVEWNPPSDRRRLVHELRWPANISPCEVRFVEVPRDVHERFPNSNVIPLHQMIAKNVGIRRARGQFILVTNLDIIFSDAFMRFLSECRLEAGTMYRMDRLDVANNLPPGATIDDLLDFCESHVLRVFAREGGFGLDAKGFPVPVRDDILAPGAGILFGAGWHGVERSGPDVYRWPGPEADFYFQRPRHAAPRLLMDLEAGPSGGPDPVTLEVVDPDGCVQASIDLTGRAIVRLSFPSQLSAGRLVFRTRGRGLPLIRDPRILHLRVYGVAWEAAPDGTEWISLPRESNGSVEPAIRVLSIEERQIRLAVRAGSGPKPGSFDLDVRDSVGNVVFNQAGPAAGSEQVITLNLNYSLSAEPQPSSSWSLEIVRAKQVRDWTTAYHAVNPLAPMIQRAAYLHTNACGDFTLLSRDDWSSLRGYPEFPIWPMHIDALFCYAAFHAGLREEILRDPMRVYHIEHLSAAGWTPEGENVRNARLEAKGLSEMQYVEFVKWVNLMRRFNAPIIFTSAEWGLADVEFAETKI